MLASPGQHQKYLVELIVMRGSRRKFWRRETAPEVDLDWFRGRGVTDPDWAFRAWQDWLKEDHTPETKFRKALAMAVGVEVGAVSHYLTHWENPDSNRADHLSLKTLKDLDDAALSLGCEPPHPFLEPIPMQEGGRKRILLFAELSSVPSTRFHLSVLESMALRKNW